jgi:hypothetical protein
LGSREKLKKENRKTEGDRIVGKGRLISAERKSQATQASGTRVKCGGLKWRTAAAVRAAWQGRWRR